MENLPDFDAIMTTITDWTNRILSVELPTPDAVLIFAFILIAFAMRLAARSSKDDVRTEIEEIYQTELLLANRRAQQAKGDLRKAHLEIERERQKRRRETMRGGDTRRTNGPRLVEANKTIQQV
jgi:hypothetical protein